jgi:hypothetical protein
MLSILILPVACTLSIVLSEASESVPVGSPVALSIKKCDYDREGNLVVAFSITYPVPVADRQLPSVLYYDETDWANDSVRRTLWLRVRGKAPIQVIEERSLIGTWHLNPKKNMKVFKAGVSVSGYARLDGNGLQNAIRTLGSPPEDGYECMLVLELYAKKERPWTIESSKEGAVVSVLDESGTWKSRRLGADEAQKAILRRPRSFHDMNCGSIDNSTGNEVGSSGGFAFRATSPWVMIQANRVVELGKGRDSDKLPP